MKIQHPPRFVQTYSDFREPSRRGTIGDNGGLYTPHGLYGYDPRVVNQLDRHPYVWMVVRIREMNEINAWLDGRKRTLIAFGVIDGP